MAKPSRKKEAVLRPLTAESAEALLSGGDDYEEKMTALYLLNMMKATLPSSPVAYKICTAFESNRDFIGGDIDTSEFPYKKKSGTAKTAYPMKNKPERNAVDARDWEFLKSRLEADLEGFNPMENQSTSVKNLRVLSKSLYLNELETDLLTFLHTVGNNARFTSFVQDIIGSDRTRIPALTARLLGRNEEITNVTACFESKSTLINCGLLDLAEIDDEDELFHQVEYTIQHLISTPELDPSMFVESVLGKPAVSDLTVGDFSSLSQDIEEICKIIKKAVADGETGINILLHGPAGSGKTALAGAIAAELNLSLFAVGEDEDAPDEKGGASRHRLNKVFQGHSFLKGRKNAILLFDEIEDLLIKGTDTDKKADTQSKIIVNRLMENNPVVTIWAGNDPDKFHESLRQRFAYSLYVDYPPMMIRKKVWEKQLALKGAQLPDKDVTYLARQFMAPPRMIANAIRLAKMTEVTVPAIENFLKSSSKITYGDADAVRSGTSISEKFDLALINYEQAKENKVKSIVASGSSPRPYSMLVTGKPGTGIRSLGRYLAENAVMNTAEWDMGALVAPNPMMPPEVKIRRAFQAANDSRNLLIISNIEALSSDPQSSSARWNEGGLADIFMECAYDHRLPMIVSSYQTDIEIPNLIKSVFSLELKVGVLTPDQCRLAYQTYFGAEAGGSPGVAAGL